MSATFYLGNGTVLGQKILAGIELWNSDGSVVPVLKVSEMRCECVQCTCMIFTVVRYDVMRFTMHW